MAAAQQSGCPPALNRGVVAESLPQAGCAGGAWRAPAGAEADPTVRANAVSEAGERSGLWGPASEPVGGAGGAKPPG